MLSKFVKTKVMNTEIVFNLDQKEASVFVMKIYESNVSEVWDHFTKPELLDLWWAPKPWKCETQKYDFQPGGKWHYAMVGPDGEREYANAEFTEINPHRSISWKDYFSDANENPNTDLPSVSWLIGFTGVEEGTKLTVNLHFANAEEMNQLVEMGFEEGFKMGLNQLEDLLKN